MCLCEQSEPKKKIARKKVQTKLDEVFSNKGYYNDVHCKVVGTAARAGKKTVVEKKTQIERLVALNGELIVSWLPNSILIRSGYKVNTSILTD